MPKVKIGEETHDVELDAITFEEGTRVLKDGEVPEGLVTQATLDATITSRLKRQKDSLKSDAEFTRSILEAHGVPLDEEGAVAIPEPSAQPEFDAAAEREKIKKAVLRDEVEPLRQQLSEQTTRAETLLGSRKEAEILRIANQMGVEDIYLRAPVEGARPPILNIVDPAIDYDSEHDMFAVREGDGFAPATKEGKPWQGIDDLFGRFSKDKAYAYLFKDKRPGSTGYSQPSQNGSAPSGLTKTALLADPGKMTAFVSENGREAFEQLPR